MFEPGTHNITVVCGDSLVQRFRFRDRDDYIILYSLAPVVKILGAGDEVIAEFTTGLPNEEKIGSNKLSIVNDDVLLWELDPEETFLYTPGEYTYTLELTFGTNVITMVSGTIQFIER